MNDETIVAVYDTAEHASLAIRDLEAAGVPAGAISRHAEADVTAGSTTTTGCAGTRAGFLGQLVRRRTGV